MIEVKAVTDDNVEVEKVDLFAVIRDGKREIFQIPAKPRANLALKVLRFTEEHGEVVGQLMLLEALLGKDGYAALADCDGLTQEQLNDIAKEAMERCMGALEDSSGNSGSGSTK